MKIFNLTLHELNIYNANGDVVTVPRTGRVARVHEVREPIGSKCSATLVMIGHFEDATEAAKAKEIIDALTEQVAKDLESGALVFGSPSDRYGKEMLDLLGRLNVASIGPAELEQFAYEVNVKVEGQSVVITTDELDIAAFLKVLLLRGARVEVYSAHNHPDTARGRGK